MNIQTIGSIIKQERIACRLSQKALAEASHLSRVTIVNLEKGKGGDIGVVKLSEIADITGKPIFSTGKKWILSKCCLVILIQAIKRQ